MWMRVLEAEGPNNQKAIIFNVLQYIGGLGMVRWQMKLS
jgi:hypothetical protein